LIKHRDKIAFTSAGSGIVLLGSSAPKQQLPNTHFKFRALFINFQKYLAFLQRNGTYSEIMTLLGTKNLTTAFGKKVKIMSFSVCLYCHVLMFARAL
jgi:hypothetical protein